MTSIKINPYSTGYLKDENRMTALLLHVLDECSLTNQFLEFLFKEKFEGEFDIGLQLQKKFTLPVKKQYIMGICNPIKGKEAKIESVKEYFKNNQNSSHEDSKLKDGYPDAFFYNKETEVLVLLETKIGNNKITSSQWERHKNTHGNGEEWGERIVFWEDIYTFLMNIHHQSNNDLIKYITRQFTGIIGYEELTKFDLDYFVTIAGSNSNLVRNILEYIYGQYPSELESSLQRHNKYELRLTSKRRTRFFTIILNQQRIILHFDNGFEYRKLLKETYGIYFPQGTKENIEKGVIYTGKQDEVSIPFDNINPETLKLIPQSSINHNDSDILMLDLKHLIRLSFMNRVSN